MIAEATTNPSTGYAASTVHPLKDDSALAPAVDLGPHRLRFSTMRLEYMSKHYANDRDVSRFVNPKRGFFEGYIPNRNAQIDHRLIITGKPRRCVRTLAAGMQSGLSTPSRPWFLLGLPDQDLEKFGPVKYWLEQVRDILMRIFSASRIYHAFHQTYEELGIFGTGAYGIFEDYANVIRVTTYTKGEYYCAVDGNGMVNSLARRFFKTVDATVQEYGFKNCSKRTQTAYNAGQRDTYVEIHELCEPNTTRIEGRYDWQGKKFRQISWEFAGEENRALRIGGYNEFPFPVPRWDVVTTADSMGTGPAGFCLGDIKSTYKLTKDLLLGLEKKVNPPVNVSSNVQGQANLTPGGITRTSAQSPDGGAKAAYEVDIDVKDGMEFLRFFIQSLEEEFYVDLFAAMLSAPDATQRTAAEIAARHEEKLLLLGPVLERVFTEMFGPTIERTFMVSLRAGILPPPPREVQGMQLIPKYISLLAQAQQQVAQTSIEKGLAFAGNLKAIAPQALDVFNFDEMAREAGKALAMPEKCIHTPEETDQIREANAQKQAEIEAQQNLMAATVAAKNLGQTQLGSGNALEHVTGVQPGGTA